MNISLSKKDSWNGPKMLELLTLSAIVESKACLAFFPLYQNAFLLCHVPNSLFFPLWHVKISRKTKDPCNRSNISLSDRSNTPNCILQDSRIRVAKPKLSNCFLYPEPQISFHLGLDCRPFSPLKTSHKKCQSFPSTRFLSLSSLSLSHPHTVNLH